MLLLGLHCPSAAARIQSFTVTAFSSVNASTPSCPSSRPQPDSLKPPNGRLGSKTLKQFTQTAPAFNASPNGTLWKHRASRCLRPNRNGFDWRRVGFLPHSQMASHREPAQRFLRAEHSLQGWCSAERLVRKSSHVHRRACRLPGSLPLLLAPRSKMLHSIQLNLRHQRTNLTFPIERGAKLDFPGPPPDTLHDSVKDFFLSIQARAGTTDLACITKIAIAAAGIANSRSVSAK